MTHLRCDVRIVDSDDNVVIALKYCYDDTTERQFRFQRNKSETLKQTFARISLNVNNKKTKKGKDKRNVEQKSIRVELKDNDRTVSEDSLNKDVWKSGLLFTIGDHSYRVVVNAPAVTAIRLPKSIMSSFTIFPIVSLEFCSINDCQYSWFRQQSSSSDWLLVGQEFSYNTSGADVGSKLKLICEPSGGTAKEAVIEEPIGANPGLCPFEERQLFCREVTSFGFIRVLSYNILADTYADSDYSRTVLYPYCPAYALAIDYRKQLLFKEIIGYKADVCCLQEVDKTLFDNELNPIMTYFECGNQLEFKYGSHFAEKGSTGEGLAVFYNKSKFQLLSAKTYSYAQELQSNPLFGQLLADVSANDKLLERLMARKTVFQSILLKSLEHENRAILLGNTHLYFHPDSDHIRLIQSYIFVKHLENYIKLLTKSKPELKVSPLLCGDFNSCPEFGVYLLMTTGFVDKSIEDFKSNSDETIDGLEMCHSLSLESACGRPLYTHYTPFFSGCLDYIFYDTSQLTLSEVIPLPSHEEVTQNTAIPSVLFPSDHLALVSVLRWKHS